MLSTSDDKPLLSRQEADLAAVERLRLVGYKGPVFEDFAADLYRYAWPVMLDGIRTGRIVRIQTATPHSTITIDDRQLLHDSSSEREELALASIARAIPKFIASLKSGHWDPSKGRSLRSYFICACAQAFWEEYELWSAQRRRHLRAVANLAKDGSMHGRLSDSTEEQQEYRQAVELLLSKAERKSPELEATLRCMLGGMTACEAASKLGYSERAVEGRLYQFRKTAWGLVRSGRIDPALVPGSRARLAREKAGANR
jgi:DNA-directed RNA polymerase specialized sigma24 family protein